MARFTIITVLCSTLLASCGGGDEEKQTTDTNELLGTWKKSCFMDDSDQNDIEYFTEIYEFKEDVINISFTLYATSTCENEVFSGSVELAYVVGDKSTTAAGDEVTNIDITMPDSEVILDIFKVEQSYLYLGEERSDNLRPDIINFKNWYEKQY